MNAPSHCPLCRKAGWKWDTSIRAKSEMHGACVECESQYFWNGSEFEWVGYSTVRDAKDAENDVRDCFDA